jgi:hypothetical protein
MAKPVVNLEGEVWKPVVGFEGLYEVSDEGRAKSLMRVVRRKRRNAAEEYMPVPERLLRPWRTNKLGHVSLSLNTGGNTTKRLLHRLVLEAFVGPCPAGMQACHNDGNPANNRLGNLRWDTSKANHHDKIRHGTTNRGERCGAAKLTASSVRDIRAKRASGAKVADLAKQHGVSGPTISEICNRRTWKHI